MRLTFNSAILFCFILTSLLLGPVVADSNAEGAKKTATAADVVPADKKKDSHKKKDADKKKDAGKKSKKTVKKDKPKKDGKKKDTVKKDVVKKDVAKKDAAKKKCKVKKGDSKKEEEAKKKKAAVASKTHELKKEPFVIKVTLKGTFEAQKMAEVSIRPEAWSGFTVLKAVEHGARVKQGDLLVALDPEKIDRAIADLRTELRLAELALKKAEKELQTIETVAPIELAALERSKRIADEDYDYFLKYELPFTKEAVKFSLKSRKNYLDYQKEELRQLEKMYKADEITEETEEIVLRRTRDAVEAGEFYLKDTKARCDRALKYALPRKKSQFKDAHKRQDLIFQASKVLLPVELEKKRIEFEKMKVQHERAEKKLKDILADRALMTVKSPADGIVYYGRCVNGKWTGGQSDGKFKRDSSLPIKQAFMTIVKTRPMRIAAQVPEKELHNIHGGLKGKAKPTGYPDVKLYAIVDEVAAIPNGSNFAAKITVALDKQAKPLMPGMTCEVKLIAYEKKDALAVPLAALKADPLEEDKFFAQVVGKDGKSKRREVAVGRRNGKKVEILGGLKVGDKILAVYPKDEK